MAMIGKIGFLFWILMIGFQSFAQQVPQGLLGKERSRYLKAQEEIARGNRAYDRVMVLYQDMDSLSRVDAGGVLPKRLSLQNEVYQRTISAGSLFTTGYGDVFAILTEAYQRYQKQNPQLASQVRDAVKAGDAKMRTAHKLYRKARRFPNEGRAMDMALQALNYQKESVDQLLSAGTLLVQSVEEADQERLLAQKAMRDSLRTIPSPQEFDNAGHRPVITVPSSVEFHNVYYTVQFKTLTRQASPQNLQAWYAGKETVTVTRFDQYYRYSVGRFTSLAEARSFMEREQMKGFVVAYQGDQRIAVVQARRMLGR